jgi:hypothetical protein
LLIIFAARILVAQGWYISASNLSFYPQPT